MKISKQKLTASIILLVILGLVALGYYFYSINIYNKKKAQPAELSAIKLFDSTCPNCFKLDTLLAVLKKEDVVFKNIREVDVSSEEGKNLIDEYNIIKTPILLISGEIDKNADFVKLWQGFGEKKEQILISNVFPPFKDLKSGVIEGLVDLTVIYDSTCQECYNTKLHTTFLEADGIYPVTTAKLDISDPAAQNLIKKYNITKVPTIILSPAASYYKKFTENWQSDGIIADDGYYIFTSPEKIGTYKDLEKNTIIKK